LNLIYHDVFAQGVVELMLEYRLKIHDFGLIHTCRINLLRDVAFIPSKYYSLRLIIHVCLQNFVLWRLNI